MTPLTPEQKQIRKEVKKELFPEITPQAFNLLRRIYNACVWLKRGGAKYDNTILNTFEEILKKYKELGQYMEGIEFRCCKDLHCMKLIKDAYAVTRYSFEPSIPFIDAFNKYEQNLLNRININKKIHFSIELTQGECCFLLYLHPEIDMGAILQMAELNATMYIKQAREQGKKDNEKQQRQAQNKKQNQPRKPGQTFIMDPHNLNNKLMAARKIK